jgi:cell division protease FtsH
MKLSIKIKILLIIVISSAVLSSVFFYLNRDNGYKDISYRDFMAYVEDGEIDRVELNNNARITGKLKNGERFITDNPRTENFKETLLLNNVTVIENSSSELAKQGITFSIFLVGIGIIAYFMNNNISKRAEKEMTLMSEMENGEDSSSRITFLDVAGNDEVKENLKELVDFLKNPEKYTKYGARMPKGILLYGPPGTGKTLLAKALAGEANVPFFPVSGSDFIQVYAGLGASRIRTLFKKAKQYGKSVIFIDEIDALGKKRKGSMSNGGSEESDRTLNALLTEMSGFKENQGIIVMAATNRIDTLDEALLRPGRFDKQVEVGLPDVNARYKILKLHSKNKPISKDVDLMKVAHETSYFSGANLENLLNESAMIAARENAHFIAEEHINKAFFNVLVGDEKKDRSSISEIDKKITAYHEAGHAIVAKKVSKENRVTKVSIIPSTKGFGGFSMNIPPDKMYQTKLDIINNIMVCLGGRASEEITFGFDKITTGASSDLKKATELALSIVGVFGMDEEMGLVNYEVALGQNIGANTTLLERARQLIDELYEDVKNILLENEDKLKLVAGKLIEKENIGEEELNNLIA